MLGFEAKTVSELVGFPAFSGETAVEEITAIELDTRLGG